MSADLISDALNNIGSLLAGIGGLGTAAYGVVDTSKAFWGGASNIGFGFVRNAVEPFIKGTGDGSEQTVFGRTQILVTLRANWLNGVAKADQKAAAKSLIRLCLTRGNANQLAIAAGVDQAELSTVAQSINNGTPLSLQDINILGRFDAIVSAVLDAAYERADQQYRNAAKGLAALVSIVIAAIGGGILFHAQASPWSLSGYLCSKEFLFSILVGAGAIPLAPIAKDLSSTLVAAVGALRATKR